jgi:hypothetical protein
MKQKINEKSDQTIQLMLGYLCISTEIEASLVRKVQILDRFKIEDKMIAQICGCSIQSIYNARQQAKKNK